MLALHQHLGLYHSYLEICEIGESSVSAFQHLGADKMALAEADVHAIILACDSDGVLAQLVERLNGIEEVRGSNPLGSILDYQCVMIISAQT